MSVSSISTSSTYAAGTQQRPQRPNDEISSGVDTLLKAVQSGDKDTIQSAYDSLSKAVSAKESSSSSSSSTSSTSSTSNSDNPLNKLLSTVSDALQSGDVSNLAATLQAQAPQVSGGGGPGGAGGPPPGGPPPGGQQGGPSDEVKSAIGGLAESLSSGDLSGAQSAYSALSDILSKEADGNSSSSSSSSSSSTSSSTSSSSTSSSTTSSSTSSPKDKFDSTLSDIGSALSSGNLSQAQQLFSSLLPRGSSMNVYA